MRRSLERSLQLEQRNKRWSRGGHSGAGEKWKSKGFSQGRIVTRNREAAEYDRNKMLL